MYKTKLCMATSRSFGIDTETQIRKFREAGFEGFFTSYNEDVKKCRELADELGMIYQSVHAPTGKMCKVWDEGEEGDEFIEKLLSCVRNCAEYKVPMIVMHIWGGKGGLSQEPCALGIERIRKVADEAKNLGVKIAFENTGHLNYLNAVMEAFKEYNNVGFCFDSGHQLCYTPDTDVMELYGDRLICTHLNDNLGVSDFDGKTTNQDDLHLLPFDGIGDWDDITRKLNKFGYDRELTFEFSIENCDNRYDNEKYQRVSIEQYIAEAYARACRVAMLKNRNK